MSLHVTLHGVDHSGQVPGANRRRRAEEGGQERPARSG